MAPPAVTRDVGFRTTTPAALLGRTRATTGSAVSRAGRIAHSISVIRLITDSAGSDQKSVHMPRSLACPIVCSLANNFGPEVLHRRHYAIFAEQNGAAEQRTVALFFGRNKDNRARHECPALCPASRTNATIGTLAGMVIVFIAALIGDGYRLARRCFCTLLAMVAFVIMLEGPRSQG